MVKFEVLNEDGSSVGCTFGFPLGVQKGWIVTRTNCFLPEYTSNGLGIHDTYTMFGLVNFAKKRYKVNIYEKGFQTPTRTKYITYQ